jgi:hypothetical protein
MHCALVSHFSDGRTLSITDRTPDPLIYALRRPQDLWSARPGASVAELLAWHLEVRREFELVLDIRLTEEMTPNA